MLRHHTIKCDFGTFFLDNPTPTFPPLEYNSNDYFTNNDVMRWQNPPIKKQHRVNFSWESNRLHRHNEGFVPNRPQGQNPRLFE